MADPFCTDFDASSALQHSPDGVNGEAEGSLEDFEKSFAAEQPDVAELICELDQSPVTKSKKQEKRDRVAKLEEMTLSGRRLFEKRVQQQNRYGFSSG
ncbi:hypothetical protein OESDEN_20539 [Oesophagostomum dentatum]|uniref:Uncharacterized protein n=1 Tax=Oesophagostomum dentatum TaxID=61180 RepID=A0A0B1S4E0_OESDE|nr:hypothetical protein OESDEN_20539 [Oesophagostomum dentatum]